jgi:wyosine [tRNA(Phe)-imidazoG37] synthetase (radical SAM superfamily)
MQDALESDNPLFTSHPRGFAANLYVYPVLSRRAGGISIGVNLNLDKTCNFHCVYCQVDREGEGTSRAGKKGTGPVCAQPSSPDLDHLEDELDRMVDLIVSGRIFEGPQFQGAPSALRRLNDIALSGNGEPTAAANFDEAVDRCAAVRRRHGLDDMKLVLITNASLFHLPRVRRALETLDGNGGEIWAKLDAGTEDYYTLVNRSAVPWRRLLDNLREAARARPIVIQSLFLRLRGQPPPPAELEAYCDRLKEILGAGGRIKLVQIHTIARKPAEAWVEPLTDAEVDAIAETVRRQTGLPAAAFYGSQELRVESRE